MVELQSCYLLEEMRSRSAPGRSRPLAPA